MMGRMDFAMKDVMASSSIPSTMPSGTNEATTFITAPNAYPCQHAAAVSLPVLPFPPFVSGV